MRIYWLALLTVPLLGSAQGPIDTRNGLAPSLAFLRLNPRGALLAPGEQSLTFSSLSANNFDLKTDFKEDQETQRLNLSYGRGFDRGEWRLDLPLMARDGGFLDPVINAFHQAIGIHRRHPFYGSVEQLPGSGTFGNAAGIGDLQTTYSHPIGPQTLYSVALKLPTGNAGGLLGSGGVDFGSSIFSRWKLGPRFELYGQAGFVFQGKPTRLANARSLIDQESLALEYKKNSRDYWLLQSQSEPGAVVVHVPEADAAHRILTLGYSRKLSDRESLQFYICENGDFLNFQYPWLVDVAPDFTVGLNITKHWR